MLTRRSGEEEAIRLGLRLYEADREREQIDAATRAALQEMELPPEYLERARAQLAAESMRRRRVGRTVAAATAAVALSLAAGWLLTHRAPSVPIHDDFQSAPAERWETMKNVESDGSLRFVDEGAERFARLTVDRFVDSTEPVPGDYWLQMRSTDGTKDVRSLRMVRFRARCEGLRSVRLRFVDGKVNWMSPPVELKADWAEYQVPLAGLRRMVRSGNRYEPTEGSGRIQEFQELQFQVGNHVNRRNDHGHVDIDDVAVE